MLLFLDHPTFYLIHHFIFLCDFTIQDQDEDLTELMERMKEASYQSMRSHSNTLDGQSNWFVNDLTHPSKYIAATPFELYELFDSRVQWIGFEFQEMETTDYGTISAVQEDRDHHNGCVVTLYKKDTLVPDKDMQKFLDCMVKCVGINKTLEFFEDSVFDDIAKSEFDHGQKLEVRMRKQIDILNGNANKTKKMKACKVLWSIWFDKDAITGIISITRWISQESRIDIEMIESPLQREIKAEMGPEFKWKNGKLGTVNFVSLPMIKLHYDESFNSTLPARMPGRFWTCGSSKRFIKRRTDDDDDCDGAIQVFEEKLFRPEKKKNYNVEDYKVKVNLKFDGDYMFLECELGAAIERGVDGYVQELFRRPDIFEHAINQKFNYYWGVDEYPKLYAHQKLRDEQQALLTKIERYERKMEAQKRDINKLKQKKIKIKKQKDKNKNKEEKKDSAAEEDESDSAGSDEAKEKEKKQKNRERNKDKRKNRTKKKKQNGDAQEDNSDSEDKDTEKEKKKKKKNQNKNNDQKEKKKKKPEQDKSDSGEQKTKKKSEINKNKNKKRKEERNGDSEQDDESSSGSDDESSSGSDDD